LIGYIEYGEEIDHFLRLMKTISGRNYAILVENQLIDPVDWAAVSRANPRIRRVADHTRIGSNAVRSIRKRCRRVGIRRTPSGKNLVLPKTKKWRRNARPKKRLIVLPKKRLIVLLRKRLTKRLSKKLTKRLAKNQALLKN